jgi:hypothetical protein
MAINQCSKEIALADIKKLIEQNKLEKVGSGRSVLYLLKT